MISSKSSALKAYNSPNSHLNKQPTNIFNTDQLSRVGFSKPSFNKIPVGQPPNINDKINQLYNLIEEQRNNRQKDFAILLEKIKNIKCKHPILIEKNIKQKVSKKQSVKKGQISSSILGSKADSLQVMYLSESRQGKKHMKSQKNIQTNFGNYKTNQTVSNLSSTRQNYLKINQFQRYMQDQNIKMKNLQEIISTCTQQIQKMKQKINRIDQIKGKVPPEITQQNRTLLFDQIEDILNNKLQQQRNLRAQFQQTISQSLSQFQSRCIRQISTLGQIVNSNLQQMHKSIVTQTEMRISDRISKFNTQQIQSICLQQNTLTFKIQNIQQKLLQLQQSIRQSLGKQNPQVAANMSEKYQKILTQMQFIQEKIIFLQSKKNQYLVKQDKDKEREEDTTVESLQKINSKQFQDKLNQTNALNIQHGKSTVEPNSSQVCQQNKINQSKNLPDMKIYQSCGQHDQILSQIMQLLSQNCTYLETRNLALEENIRQMVQVINRLLAKFKNYK